MNVNQDKNKHKFTLSIEGKSATINYKIENNNAYLIYSDVPDSFRRRGIG
jgi:predicted GNAT family acetyltransferase